MLNPNPPISPAPWAVVPKTAHDVSIVAADGMPVCSMYFHNDAGNALLVAQAPALQKALQDLLDAMAASDHAGVNGTTSMQGAATMDLLNAKSAARAALARAVGRPVA